MQKITTPKGETLIVLPVAEYEELLDACDIAAASKVVADIKAGNDEWVPSAIVDALIDGENPVRVWRKHRGITALDLAQKTQLSAAYISEIETGKKDGSISAIKRIASIPEIDLDDLV